MEIALAAICCLVGLVIIAMDVIGGWRRDLPAWRAILRFNDESRRSASVYSVGFMWLVAGGASATGGWLLLTPVAALAITLMLMVPDRLNGQTESQADGSADSGGHVRMK